MIFNLQKYVATKVHTYEGRLVSLKARQMNGMAHVHVHVHVRQPVETKITEGGCSGANSGCRVQGICRV